MYTLIAKTYKTKLTYKADELKTVFEKMRFFKTNNYAYDCFLIYKNNKIILREIIGTDLIYKRLR